MKNKKLWILAFVVIAGLTAGYLAISSGAEETVVETVKENTVKKGDLVIDFLSDGLVTMDEYDLSFKTSGVVKDVNVALGDWLQPGDAIASLDTAELELKRRQLEIAIATLKEKNSVSAMDYAYDQAAQKAVIDGVEGDLEDARDKLELMNLHPELYAAAELENQSKMVSELESKLNIENLKLTRALINPTTQNNLALEDMMIDLALMDLDFASTTLTSPIEGMVVKINGAEQSTVGTTNVFAVIHDSENPYIVSMVSELDIHNVFVGQKVYAEFESDFGVPYTGVLSHVSNVPSIDNNNIVTYRVEITLEKAPESIKAGLSTVLSFILKEKTEVLVLPNAAVKIVDNQQVVEVKTGTGSETRAIVTGLTDGINVEVISGLEAGDVVLIRSTK